MLSSFDWIRRSRTGAELLATLRYFAAESPLYAPFSKGGIKGGFSYEEEIGPPPSALNSPCQRCWIYPRVPSSEQEDDPYCKTCKAIIRKTRGLGNTSRRSVVVWGYTNRLPKQLRNGTRGEGETKGKKSKPLLGIYAHNENRFLLMMYRRNLRHWLRELILYDGADLKGLIQILPTMGPGTEIGMGDVLCRAVHHEATLPMDHLRVRFFSNPYQLLKPHIRDRQGLLTFEVAEFLNLLETAVVFRTLLRPEEQRMLHEILNIDDATEEQFYWGRFLGNLSQEAKDMLNSWKIRNWPENRIRLLYELIDYVFLPQFH